MLNKIKNRIDLFSDVVAGTEVSGAVSSNLDEGLKEVVSVLMEVKNNDNNLYVIGNGGSAAIASHVVVDFVNVAGIKAFTLHESSMISCMSNDYGYNNSFSHPLGCFLRSDDVLIAVSSSGESDNIIKTAQYSKGIGATVITFSGFNKANRLRKLGHYNFWCNSGDYGIIEVAHQFLLHNVTDRFGVLSENDSK